MAQVLRRSASRRVFCFLWGLVVLGGLVRIAVYSRTAEAVQAQPNQWPVESAIPFPAGRPTLLVTLHPRCVCSRATLEELNRLLAQTRAPLRVDALVYQPKGAPASWQESDLARKVRSIPGIEVRTDPDGAESARFGMSVSGQTALYAPDGRLLFSGGITAARGHIGDNAGRSAILSILSKDKPRTVRTPVFGCSIRDRA